MSQRGAHDKEILLFDRHFLSPFDMNLVTPDQLQHLGSAAGDEPAVLQSLPDVFTAFGDAKLDDEIFLHVVVERVRVVLGQQPATDGQEIDQASGQHNQAKVGEFEHADFTSKTRIVFENARGENIGGRADHSKRAAEHAEEANRQQHPRCLESAATCHVKDQRNRHRNRRGVVDEPGNGAHQQCHDQQLAQFGFADQGK